MTTSCEWNVEDEMPLAMFMGDERNRATFLNPVMASPWRSVMPMGCPHSATNDKPHVKRKPTKRDRSVLRLNRLHPELKKSKLRAALTLCNGDIGESIRLIRDCTRKMQMKTINNNNNNSEKADQIEAERETQEYTVAPLGSFPKSSGVAPTPAIATPASDSSATASSDMRSTLTADGSSLLLDSDEMDDCVLSDSDQTESECSTCKKVTWASQKRVGILLKRTGSGNYTTTLL